MIKYDEKWIKTVLDGFREFLRQSVQFECACCEKWKRPSEAAGVHVYQPNNAELEKAMITSDGKPRLGLYAICLECVDSFSEEIVYQKVTRNLAAKGLFGDKPLSMP